MAGIGQDLKKIYSDETRIVENASLCSMEEKEEGERLSEDDITTDECEKEDPSEEEGA